MCLTVLWINLETYFARSIAQELTRDDGVFMPKIHRHPLYFDQNVFFYNHCDLCSTRLKTSGAWRCILCDFDLCPTCMKRDDLPNVSENIIRSDKGVAEQKTTSNVSFFLRGIEIARPQAMLVTIALFVLLLSTSTQLILPNVQGKIIDKLVPEANGRVDKSGFFHYVVLYVIVLVFQGLLAAIHSTTMQLVSAKINAQVRNQLYERTILQDVVYFDGTTTGHVTSRLSYDGKLLPNTHIFWISY